MFSVKILDKKGRPTSFAYDRLIPLLCPTLYHFQNNSLDVLRATPAYRRTELIVGIDALDLMYRKNQDFIASQTMEEHFKGCVDAMATHYKNHGSDINDIAEAISLITTVFGVECREMMLPEHVLCVGISHFHKMLSVHPDFKRLKGKNLELYQALEAIAHKPDHLKKPNDLVHMIHLINQFEIPEIKEIQVSFVSKHYQRQLLALSVTPVTGAASSSTLFQPNPEDVCRPIPEELALICIQYKKETDEEPSGMASKKHYERLIRRISFVGDHENLTTLLGHPVVMTMHVDVNSKMSIGLASTALHIVIDQANKMPEEQQEKYQRCYDVLMAHGANASLAMVDKNNKTPIDYDLHHLFSERKESELTMR